MPHEHPSAGRKLSIIVIGSRTNQIEDLLPLLGSTLQALEIVQPDQTVAIRE